MTALAKAIAGILKEYASQYQADTELRLSFLGPPSRLMEQVFNELSEGGDFPLPVLYLVTELPAGTPNPPIGGSGICQAGDLLERRNSSFPRFLALVSPGIHESLSVENTTGKIGVAEENNGRSTAFRDWWSDSFVQELLAIGLGKLGIRRGQDEFQEAAGLLRAGAEALDRMDTSPAHREGCWDILCRLYSLPAHLRDHSVDLLVSLACGFPPPLERGLSAKRQRTVLGKIARLMSNGFGPGIEVLKEKAGDEDRKLLDGLKEHLRQSCQLPTAFERAAAAFYRPTSGLSVDQPPKWFLELTLEKWAQLLSDTGEEVGEIQISCKNAIDYPGNKSPILVEDEVELLVKADLAGGGSAEIELTRHPTGGLLATLMAGDEDAPYNDEDVPVHTSPLRYTALGEGLQQSSLRVVSLSRWKPGVFIDSRQASATAPRKSRASGARANDLEASITLNGAGGFELMVFTSPGVAPLEPAIGTVEASEANDKEEHELPIRLDSSGYWEVEAEADGEYQISIQFERQGTEEGDEERERFELKISVSVEEVDEEGCRSEFERLIRQNRRRIDRGGSKAVVQLSRNNGTATLQEWMLSQESSAKSYIPFVVAQDYLSAWKEPCWTEGHGPIFSDASFYQDPRPAVEEFTPPAAFEESRQALARWITGKGDFAGLCESAEFGRLMRIDEFAQLVEAYLDSYRDWLASDPNVACWVDVGLVVELNEQNLESDPLAILLSPLHPVRLAWHCLAQGAMFEAETKEHPCPAASVLNPDFIVDFMTIALRSATEIRPADFLAVENGTDYWSVLWSASKLKELPKWSEHAPFNGDFGITIGGLSSGFSAAQVGRALDDIGSIFCAKPSTSVLVGSSPGATDACNEGLVAWSSGRLGDSHDATERSRTGPRSLKIFDLRDVAARPDDASIANLARQTSNSVQWFVGRPERNKPDLGIIAQLDLADQSLAKFSERSPLGIGGLLRHRVRRQHGQRFLSESRQASSVVDCHDMLSNKVATTIGVLENQGEEPTGLQFAPNTRVLEQMLDEHGAEFVAVSSAAIDPATFLGDWLDGTYLWDYELPAYSRRSGDSNGYYLLSKIHQADKEALSLAFQGLPECEDIGEGALGELLLEVSRRGIPTIKGLSGGDRSATGDLGVFVAGRILQDNFRAVGGPDSLLPLFEGNRDAASVCLIVPVDPFEGYLSDLARCLGRKFEDVTRKRPDLLVVGATFDASRVRIKLTPIEVKCRTSATLASPGEALEQAQALSNLLLAMAPSQEQPLLWTLAFQHLLVSMIGFGMRVYGRHPSIVDREDDWTRLHGRLVSEVLDPGADISIDPNGRLIVIDTIEASKPQDIDGDGFKETLRISLADAGKIVGGDPVDLYQTLRDAFGTWELLPGEGTSGNLPAMHGTEGKKETSDKSKPASIGAVNTKSEGDGVDASVHPASTQQGEQPEEEGTKEVEPENGTGNEGEWGGAGEGSVKDDGAGASDDLEPLATDGVKIAIGKTLDDLQARDLELNISDTNLNQLNMGVVGDLGTGKTQLLMSLISQIAGSAPQNRGAGPKFLIFDYKRDYSKEEFVQATGAKVVKPFGLPLNLFDTSGMEEGPPPWLDRFRFFTDVLDKIYSGIGPVQRQNLKKAVQTAYSNCESIGRQPTLYDVHGEYSAMLDGKSDAPMSIIDDFVDMGIFASDPSKTVPFSEFLDGVVVVSLDALGQDDRSKNMVVAVMLNMFYENMLRTEKKPYVGEDPQLRAIESFLLVDEADNIMQYEFDVLRKLLLQGREFGTGIILASQYLRHFKVNATDYREPLLTWFIHKVPNVTAKELSAIGLTHNTADLAERIKGLGVHECLYKSFDVPGEIVRGLPFYELMKR